MAKKLLEELRKEGLHKNVNKDVEMGAVIFVKIIALGFHK